MIIEIFQSVPITNLFRCFLWFSRCDEPWKKRRLGTWKRNTNIRSL